MSNARAALRACLAVTWILVLLVTASAACLAADAAASKPPIPPVPPKVPDELRSTMPRPPIGFTPTMPDLPEPWRGIAHPSAIQVRVSPACVQAGSKARVHAFVYDQFGAPAKDGTAVKFFAGIGKTNVPFSRTRKGVASVWLTCPDVGPVRLVATAGFVEAVAVVFFLDKRDTAEGSKASGDGGR